MESSFTVSWNPPIFSGNTAIRNYSIAIKNANNQLLAISCSSSLVRNDCVVPAAITSTNFTGLAPFSRYNIQIWASNLIGNSGKTITSTTTDETCKIILIIAIAFNNMYVMIIWISIDEMIIS